MCCSVTNQFLPLFLSRIDPGQKLLAKVKKALKPYLIRPRAPIINVGISISSSMTKNNFDTRGWGPKLRRKYTNVLFCVTNQFLPLFLSRIDPGQKLLAKVKKALKPYLIRPRAPIINVGISISSSMTKNNFDTRGWGPKLRRKYTNVLFCVTNQFLPLFLSRIVASYSSIWNKI